MKIKLLKWLFAGGCVLLAACAIITVNVYFPEKAVKEAYKSLDEILLKNEGEKSPINDKLPAPDPVAPQPNPQSKLLDKLPALSFASIAQAAEGNGGDLAIELGSMPEVVKAYAEMKQRQPGLTALFDSGAVGLTTQGLVATRGTKLGAQDEVMISAENQSRKIVISSMAKAILKVTKQEATKASLGQTMGKAAATYADTRRESAKPGWWMQLQNGRWVQK